jgi:uncharacterized cupredoxin-like copper-binding protein
MKAFLIGVVAAAALVAATSSAQATTHRSHSAALIARVKVAASEFKFVLTRRSAGRGVVIFRVTNVGKIKHDFEISGPRFRLLARKTRLLAHGQTATLRVVFLRKGPYPYKCTVPGHAAAGMKGVFRIT